MSTSRLRLAGAGLLGLACFLCGLRLLGGRALRLRLRNLGRRCVLFRFSRAVHLVSPDRAAVVTIHHSGREKQQGISSTIRLRQHQGDIGSGAIGGAGSFFICPTKSAKTTTGERHPIGAKLEESVDSDCSRGHSECGDTLRPKRLSWLSRIRTQPLFGFRCGMMVVVSIRGKLHSSLGIRAWRSCGREHTKSVRISRFRVRLGKVLSSI